MRVCDTSVCMFAGGSYAIVTSSRSSVGHALLVSPPVSAVPGDRRCLELWWSTSFPISSAALSVRVLRHDGLLRNVSWNQSNISPRSPVAWMHASVNILAEGPFQVYITAASRSA